MSARPSFSTRRKVVRIEQQSFFDGQAAAWQKWEPTGHLNCSEIFTAVDADGKPLLIGGLLTAGYHDLPPIDRQMHVRILGGEVLVKLQIVRQGDPPIQVRPGRQLQLYCKEPVVFNCEYT